MAFRFEEDLGNLYIEVMFQCLFNGFLIIMEDILGVSKEEASFQLELQLWQKMFLISKLNKMFGS